MAPKRRTSKESAAIFLKLKKDAWSYVEKYAPGCRDSWRRDVRLPDEQFLRGVTGRPLRVIAIDLRCCAKGQCLMNCECRVFLGASQLWVRGHYRDHAG